MDQDLGILKSGKEADVHVIRRRQRGPPDVARGGWPSEARRGERPTGAFDDRADFVRNNVFAAGGKLAGIPVRLDCGRDDPFIVANRAFARKLPDATVTFDDGAHTEEYWPDHAGARMTRLGKHLH